MIILTTMEGTIMIRPVLLVATVFLGASCLRCITFHPSFRLLPPESLIQKVTLKAGKETGAERTNQQIDTMLKKGLTPNDAVSIALLNNRELRAKFARIGLTEAQIQGALPENPGVNATLILDDHASMSYEAHFSQNLASILHATFEPEKP